jgi:hypothetical protein
MLRHLPTPALALVPLDSGATSSNCTRLSGEHTIARWLLMLYNFLRFVMHYAFVRPTFWHKRT